MSDRLARCAWLANFRGEPYRAAALERYARLAPHYEGTTTRIREVRAGALDLLAFQPDETVFDVACGADAILRELSWRVGPRGRVVGVEQSPAMAALAAQASEGCDNVRILCEPVESFRAPARADAVIFCCRHDVLQSPRALENLVTQVRPSARVSVAGLCRLPPWGTAVNAWVLWGARHYLTTWRGLRAPWMPLLDWCPDLRIIHRYNLGTGYLAVGGMRSR